MKPRLLDLFCGAGGASVGYSRAGFDVIGVDIQPHPDYPFTLHVADAVEYALAHADEYDAIHASPPCQAFTTMSNRWRGRGGAADAHPDLIEPTRAAIRHRPYVIENVVGARTSLHSPLTLHGGMFGLGVHRPRLFESNVLLMGELADPPVNPVGVYGKAPDGRRLFTRADGSSQHAAASLAEGAAAMGIDWMTDWSDVAEAIPPAYTEYIGVQLLAAVLNSGEREAS